MLRNRLLALGAVTVLALGVTGPAAMADTTATTSAPTVSQTANSFTVSLPGVGALSFMVDPATGAVSNVIATADPSGGFTAGTPKVTDEGVQVSFTAPDGTTQVLKVEVEREDGAIKVTAESDGDKPDGEDQASANGTTPTTEHDGDASEHQGVTTSTTEVEHEGETSTTTATAEHDGETATTSSTSSTSSTSPTSTEDGHDGSGDSSTSTSTSSGSGD